MRYGLDWNWVLLEVYVIDYHQTLIDFDKAYHEVVNVLELVHVCLLHSVQHTAKSGFLN
jgi:hypothetical protein